MLPSFEKLFMLWQDVKSTTSTISKKKRANKKSTRGKEEKTYTYPKQTTQNHGGVLNVTGGPDGGLTALAGGRFESTLGGERSGLKWAWRLGFP